MQLLGNVLLIVSLTTGALAAATAYHVPLEYSKEHFKNSDGKDLTIKADVGVVVVQNESELIAAKIDHWEMLHSQLLPHTSAAATSGHQMWLGLMDFARQQQSPVQRALSLSQISTEKLFKATYDKDTGLVLLEDGSAIPLAGNKDKLTPALLEVLKKQAQRDHPKIKQKFVVVQEFSFERWPGKWIFLVSVVGLLAGAFMVRTASKKAIAAADTPETREGPETALLEMRQMLHSLLRDVVGGEDLERLRSRLGETDLSDFNTFIRAQATLSRRMGEEGITRLRSVAGGAADEVAMEFLRQHIGAGESRRLDDMVQARAALSRRLPEDDMVGLQNLLLTPQQVDDRLKMILEKLSEAQRIHMTAFVDARPQLIARLGLGGYAELMDRFAACERQINRAWSAAADGIYDESVNCIELASELIDDAIAKLRP